MNAVTSFAVSPSTALELDAAAVAALNDSDMVDYQIAAVKGWAEAFGQKPSLDLQYALIREEGMDLSIAGMALSGQLTPEVVAEWLKESADFTFVLSGWSLVERPEDPEEMLKGIIALQHISKMVDVSIMAELATIEALGWNKEVVVKAHTEAFRRVVASNMTKLGDDGKSIFNEDGKIVKGPNYVKPDLTDLATLIIETANTGKTVH